MSCLVRGGSGGGRCSAATQLMIEATIPVGTPDELVLLLGASDQHLRRIRDSVPARISRPQRQDPRLGRRAGRLPGHRDHRAAQDHRRPRRVVTPEQVGHIIQQVVGTPTNGKTARGSMSVGRKVRPRTPGQAEYVQAIRAERSRVLQRPRRYRQDLSRRRHGRRIAQATADRQDRARAAGRRERARASASCRATCRRRSIPTCGRCSSACAR